MFNNLTDFFKKNKNIIIVFIIAILTLVCLVSIKSCINNNISTKNLKIANDSLNMKIVDFVDKNNNTHARVQELELTNKELNSINSNLQNHYKQKIDSLSDILQVKSKDIQSYITIISKSKGNGIGKIDTNINIINNINVDTSYAIHSFDNFLDYKGVINKNGLTYKYEYIDSLNVVKITKHKGFLKLRKENYWDVSNYNPNAKIIGLEQFSQSNPNKYKIFSVVVGPNVSLTNDFKVRFQPISITVGIKIFEF